MKYFLYVLLGLVIVGVVYTVFFDSTQSQPVKERQTASTETAVVSESKIDDQPPVTVTVTPLEIGENSALWKFEVTLDTHSWNLDEDLLVATTLIGDNGSVSVPIAWDGSGSGGHHREGVITFNRPDFVPDLITVRINNVGGIPERVFTWDIRK